MILYLTRLVAPYRVSFLSDLLNFFNKTDDSESILLVAKQPYRVAVFEESVILGNDVVIKCNIPSFVADFLTVASWVDSEGREFLPGLVEGKLGCFN